MERQMSILITRHEEAIPNAEMLKRFRAVDPRLGLRLVVYPMRDQANTNEHKTWAITYQWADDDKRRQMIARGQMAEDGDFDVLGWLPKDCSVEEAFSYFERTAKGLGRERGDMDRILNRLHHFNAQATEEAKKETHELAEELIETNAGTMFKNEGKTVTKVFMPGNKKPG
jgi:hypothetical protein